MAGRRELVAQGLVRLADLVKGTPPVQVQAGATPRFGPRGVETNGVARGLKPATVAAILEEADQGDLVRFAGLLEDIEDRDPHIVSVLGTRKRAVANLPWTVTPAGPRAVDRRVAELVTRRLQAITNLEDGFLDLLDAISKGVAFVELDWTVAPDGYQVQRFQYRPQRWFRTDPADPERFHVLTERDLVNGEPLVPDRFITHVSRAKSGFPTQSGLGRVLVWWWLFKSYAIKDWVSYSEMFGAPLRIGRFPQGAKDDDINQLYTALKQLGVDAVATIPAEMQVEFQAVGKDGGDTYQRLLEYCDKAISKAVLGQTLTTEAGQNGARALGQVHDLVRQDILEADAKQLARTITRDLVAPLVRYHFGPAQAVPTFGFQTEPAADEKAQADTAKVRAEVFGLARNLGVPVALAQVQEELGIRAPVGGEDLLSAPTTTTQSQGAAAATHSPSPHLVAVRNAARGPDLCPMCAGAGRGHALALADTDDLPPILAQLEREAARYLAEGGSAAWRDLVAAVQDELLRGAPSLGEMPERFLRVVAALNATHPALSLVTQELAHATLTAELVGRAQVATADQVLADVPQLPPTEAVAFWTQKLTMTADEFYGLAAAHRARAFTVSGWTCISGLAQAHQALGTVIRTGGTLADFEDALNQVAGGGALSPARLDNVFRTNWSTSYAVGRDVEQRRPDTLSRRPFWRYNTADDSRVRRAHAAQDGVVRRHDDPYWQVWSPPNGFRCRCFRTAHSMDEVQAMGWTVAEGAQDVDPLTGLAWLPDEGFRTDPARAQEGLDWIRWDELPPEWAAAISTELRGATP